MTLVANFCSDWVSAPGETIREIMETQGIEINQLATHLNLSIVQTINILDGSSQITIALARSLAKLLGGSVEFWMARECQYREDLLRLHKDHSDWVQNLPIKDMVEFKWLKKFDDAAFGYLACLRFFGVPSMAAWHKYFDGMASHYAFKKSATVAPKPLSVTAWLRQGELEARNVNCLQWDKARLREVLPELRRLAKIKNPTEFFPQVQKICSDCGVAVVAVRAPKGCPISGATRFISKNKALLLLSFRFLSDDHFWFSLFHEIGHLVLHGTDRLFIEEEGGDSTSQEEFEANEFAETLLIPPKYREDLMKLKSDSQEIIRFSVRVGVPPGIVVGQLQHAGILAHNKLNGLKRRYSWK